MSALLSLVQYVTGTDVGLRFGLEADGKVHRAPAELHGSTLMAVLADWDRASEILREVAVGLLPVIPDAVLGAPLTFPRKVICAGANYYGHAREMKAQTPNPDSEPFFFLKPPTTAVVGPGARVAIPAGFADLDWEVELAAVIGFGGRQIDEDDALNHVAGYMVANDLSARGHFSRSEAVFPAFSWDWFRHKSFDGSCPIGPGLVPAWQIPDPQNLTMTLSVNGKIKQRESTSDMVVSTARLIAAASRVVTLEPGDVVLTGTPAGVGMPKGTFLKPDDEVVAEIEGIGRLVTRMVSA